MTWRRLSEILADLCCHLMARFVSHRLRWFLSPAAVVMGILV